MFLHHLLEIPTTRIGVLVFGAYDKYGDKAFIRRIYLPTLCLTMEP